MASGLVEGFSLTSLLYYINLSRFKSPILRRVIILITTYVSSVSTTIVGSSSASSSKLEAIDDRAVAKDTSPLSISPLAKIKIFKPHKCFYV